MDNYSIVLLLLGIMMALSAVADKIKLSSPILLIVAGIGLGFIPGMPPIELNPEIILLIFLPPLLYDAAFNISSKSFKVNINTIGTLAVGLVFLTASGIAALAYFFIPGMNWPLAFVLGAILSATDAVAAISITKGLGCPGGLPVCSSSRHGNGICGMESFLNIPGTDWRRCAGRPAGRQSARFHFEVCTGE